LPRLQVLQRFRPLRLEVIAAQLREWGWKAEAIQLIETHFPEEGANLNFDRTDWISIQSHFFGLVEKADWFHIDWETERKTYRSYGVLDYLWEAYMNGDDYEFELAEYLTGIPVRCYGLNEWDLENYPGLHILAGLLHDDIPLTVDYLEDIELYDNLAEISKEQLRERLRSEDFSHFPEPLCWLPEIAGVATRDTGNIILDTSQDLFESWSHEFRWDQDLNLLRQHWQQAKPVVEKLELLVQWLNENSNNYIEMAWAIIGCDGGDDDDD